MGVNCIDVELEMCKNFRRRNILKWDEESKCACNFTVNLKDYILPGDFS